jgi:hypothetical protein
MLKVDSFLMASSTGRLYPISFLQAGIRRVEMRSALFVVSKWFMTLLKAVALPTSRCVVRYS